MKNANVRVLVMVFALIVLVAAAAGITSVVQTDKTPMQPASA